MNDEMKQKLSSLMDGEFENHSEQTVSNLLESESLRNTWWRYHLIADVLNQNLPGSLDLHLADKLTAAIAKEPVRLASYRSLTNRFLKSAAGFAIAASVAAIAIIGVQQTSNRPPDHPSIKIAETKQPQFNTNISSYTFPASTNLVTSQIEDVREVKPNPQLNSYLVNYNEVRSAQTGVQGIIPYVRIIANDDDK